VLPIHGGIEGSATFRALLNLILPALQSYAVLVGLLVPAFVRVHGTPAFAQQVRVSFLSYLASAVAYWIALGLWHGPLMIWLYHGRYTVDGPVLWLVGVIPIAAAALAVMTSALRASGRPDHIFRAALAATFVALTLGVFLIARWGLVGAVSTLLICYSV